jgi:hypothetical protein
MKTDVEANKKREGAGYSLEQVPAQEARSSPGDDPFMTAKIRRAPRRSHLAMSIQRAQTTITGMALRSS